MYKSYIDTHFHFFVIVNIFWPPLPELSYHGFTVFSEQPQHFQLTLWNLHTSNSLEVQNTSTLSGVSADLYFPPEEGRSAGSRASSIFKEAMCALALTNHVYISIYIYTYMLICSVYKQITYIMIECYCFFIWLRENLFPSSCGLIAISSSWNDSPLLSALPYKDTWKGKIQARVPVGQQLPSSW